VANGGGRPGLRGIFLGAGVLLSILGFILFRMAPEPELKEAQGVQPLSVRSFTVNPHTHQPVAEVAGLLEARNEVELFAEEEGKVIEVGAEELDFVEAGQLLLRMDPLLAELDVEQSEAALARAESELSLARASLDRQNNLAGNSVASESALDVAVNEEKVARASLKEARVALARARDGLAKKTLTAPFSGELVSFPVNVGEYVRPGERVGELFEVDRLRVTIGLADHEIVSVVRGAAAQLDVEARPGEVFHGTVLRAGGAVDSTSRKFPVQVELENTGGRLMPGMVVRVTIDLGPPIELTSIPREAVLREFGVPFVYVLAPLSEAGGWQAERRRLGVRDIPFWPIRVEVTKGLRPGERVALSSLRQLRDGTPVTPRAEDGEPSRPRVASRDDDEVAAPPADPIEGAAGRAGEGG